MQSEAASRTILWNIDHPLNVVALYALLGLTLIVAGAGIFRHTELVTGGRKSTDKPAPWYRQAFSLLTWGLFQRGVIRRPGAAAFHTLIYLGFLVLLFTTTMVFLDHDLGIRIYRGDFYLGLTVFSDVFGLGLLLGCILAAHRRYIAKPELLHQQPADAYLLGVLGFLVIQGFLLEALRIHATDDPWGHWSPVGWVLSKMFWSLSLPATSTLHFLLWWLHTLTVYTFIALLPYSKFFHAVVSLFNVQFRARIRPAGALAFEGDIEKLVEQGEEFSLGLGTISDYSWKQRLDLEACTSCGRCQEVCPAYGSGKPLSPKWLILDTRNHMLALGTTGALNPTRLPSPLKELDASLQSGFLSSNRIIPRAEGGYEYEPGFRAANALVDSSAKVLGGSLDARIAGDVIEQDVFWSCTTCMACVEACPVGIQHVDQIVGNRRNMALMHGEIPSEAQATLRALESQGNPFGPADDRATWLEGLDVPILKAGDSIEVLYWVGCVSAYDPRKQRIARSVVSLLKQAGVSFGVLGKAERCTGDPARRLGEESLYQTLAKQNIELLRSIQFRTVIANCPHCFNTLKNEYPQLGNISDSPVEVLHHTTYLSRLIQEKRLSIAAGSAPITFHDPCYLGRYNREFDAPRSLLNVVTDDSREMERSREKGMCCGAGGGHFWMDMKIGERVNVQRTNQAAETGAETVATGCPFCLHMMEDGVKLTNREESLNVKDIAELLVELGPRAMG